MPTVISDEFQLAFIHVPKCGGSTIGIQLIEQIECDPFFRQMRFVEHPGLGSIHPSHLPLRVLRDHFPEALARIENCNSFALCREPKARFASALGQHAREILKTQPDALQEQDVLDLVRRVIGDIRADRNTLLHRHIHFCPQVDFITLDARPLVRNIFPIEHLEELAGVLSQITGKPIQGRQRLNTTNHYRSPIFRAAVSALRPHAVRLLPPSAFRFVRQHVLKATTVAKEGRFQDILQKPEVADYLEELYGLDAEIHKAALASQP